MQQRAALWISGTFWISLTANIEAISGLISIYLQLKKLHRRFHLRDFSLPSNHIVKSIINTESTNNYITHHCLSFNKLMSKQQSWLHSLLIDMEDKYNEFLSTFFPFNKELSLKRKLIDFYSNRFSFHAQTQDIKNHMHILDNTIINASNDFYFSVIIVNANIRNNITTFILHIHSYNRLVTKTVHYVVNITTTEAKLFVIRYRINQAISIPNTNHIIVIIDSLHATMKIFDSLLHLFQIHYATVSHELRDFFKKDSNNYINFWDCLSKEK